MELDDEPQAALSGDTGVAVSARQRHDELNPPAQRSPRQPPRPRGLSRRARNTILTAHIIVSVGLLGDSAALLAISLRAAATDDPAVASALHGQLEIFSAMFGIPLSLAALATGVALGVGTRWGVFRYPWVVIKLVLILSVMLVGSLFIGPAETQLVDGSGEPYTQLVAGGAWDVVALSVATGLSVFKPGRARSARSSSG